VLQLIGITLLGCLLSSVDKPEESHCYRVFFLLSNLWYIPNVEWHYVKHQLFLGRLLFMAFLAVWNLLIVSLYLWNLLSVLSVQSIAFKVPLFIITFLFDDILSSLKGFCAILVVGSGDVLPPGCYCL